MNRRDKMDYYLAQVAAEVRRSRVEDPRKVETEDLLITFVKRKDEVKLSKKEAAARSKSVWFGILGLRKGQKPVHNKPPPKRK